jgi:hypothetical protein
VLSEAARRVAQSKDLFSAAHRLEKKSFGYASLAVTGAILLILELGNPMHHGWIQVSSEPMRNGLREIGRP